MSIMTVTGRKLYSGYPVESSTYVYDEDDGTSAESGWVDTKSDYVAVQIRCGTLNATSLNYRIEGRSNTYIKACDIYNASITSAQTIDTIINIAEKVKQIRVGARIDITSTPNNLHVGLILSDSK